MKNAVAYLVIGSLLPTGLAAQQVFDDPVHFTNSSNIDFSVLIKNGGGAAKGLSVEGGNSGGDAELLKVSNWDSSRTFLSVTDDRVGVGTSSPGATFTVVQGGYSPIPFYNGLSFIHQSSNPDGALLQPALELRNGGGNGYGLVSHAANNFFSGRVGVGTETPTQAIDLGSMRKNVRILYTHLGEVGSAAGTVLGNNLRASEATDRQLEIATHDDTAMHALYMKPDSGWHFLSLPQGHGNSVGTAVDLDANTKLRITTSGNVGIGVADPSQKLEVNGTIRAKEVIVETTGFPDYVFNKDYRLMSLSEVGKHIDEHGRLPGMPSGEIVDSQGLTLGEINRLLVEKVEELTLHAIQQDQKLGEQGREIAELKALVQQLTSKSRIDEQ